MKYVIAGCFFEFIDWCHENHLTPGRDAISVDGNRELIGTHFPISDIVKVGSWRERIDLAAIRNTLYRCVWPPTGHDPLFESVLRSQLFEPPWPRLKIKNRAEPWV